MITANSTSLTEVSSKESLKKKESFDSLFEEATSHMKEILDADDKSEIPMHEALQAYKKIIPELENAIKAVPKSVSKSERENVQHRLEILERCVSNTKLRIDRIKDSLASERVNPNERRNDSENSKNNNSIATNKEQQDIVDSIVETTNIALADVLGNESAKVALDETVILPNINPELFTELRSPAKGILLFGPPGNGKTMLAKACATEAGCTFINISAATIMSKWLGQGERMMKALFTVARKMQPSIIFIDEIDSMLCTRGEDESGGASRRVITEFLLQMDGVTSDISDRVLVLGATNRPYDLDDGVLRRFPRRILIDPPSEEGRANHIKHTFRKTKNDLKETDYKIIAGKTEGYSYSDLANLCREAAMYPLRDLCRDDRGSIRKRKKEDLRPVQVQDFIHALEVVKPSTTNINCQKMALFAKRYAQSK